MTASGELDAPNAKITHWARLSDVDDVLFVIWSRDGDLSIFCCDNPDWFLRCAIDLNIPHSVYAISSAGEFEFVARFQGFYGLQEGRPGWDSQFDDPLWDEVGPCGLVVGGLGGRSKDK